MAKKLPTANVELTTSQGEVKLGEGVNTQPEFAVPAEVGPPEQASAIGDLAIHSDLPSQPDTGNFHMFTARRGRIFDQRTNDPHRGHSVDHYRPNW